ncbi:MAG TPA: acyl carrier protein [Ktedonobacteraceae bacterium]|nr:acyl carrier protein [Ktedonobacteraceae bacterium]
MEEIKLKIRLFLAKFIQRDIQDHEDIFTSNFVSSLFAMQLIMFIENEFHFQIDNEELDIDNFRTIDAMSRLIIKKQGDS